MGGTVSSGQTVSLTSAASGLVVFSGGTLDVLAGGTADAAQIDGLMQVSSGGLASGVTISGSAEAIVSSGGTASGTVIDGTSLPGATLLIAAGGSAVGTVVSDGTEIVSGTASGTLVNGFFASQTVQSGGLAIATSVGDSRGGAPEQIVSSGGSARGTVISAGATEIVYGGTATGLDLLAAGSMGAAYLYLSNGSASLAAGDTASGDVLFFQGTSATLGISGTAMPSATISGFDSAGPATSDTIDLQSVAFSRGATAVLGSGNVLSVTEGGSTYALTLDPSQIFAGEAFQLAADGGSGTDITLAYSGAVVTSGQTSALTSALTGVTVFSGGTLDVLAGGTADAAVVAGALEVSSGGSASGTTVVDSGTVTVSSGGIASATVISGGRGAVAGAMLVVSGGGSTVGTVVDQGVEQVAGTASRTVISGLFASQTVQSGGLAIGTSVGYAGGGITEQIVSSGGSARDTVVSAGADELIYGGTATGIALLGGGAAGGAYLYLSTGSASLAAGDIASGDHIYFQGASATLGISGTAMPSATISNFDSGGPTMADTIDLQSVAFSQGATAVLGSGNVLSVTEGGSTFTLNLAPSQSFFGEAFHLAADGGSGTAITLAYSGTVVTSGQTSTLTSAQSGIAVFAGGTLDVVAGGTANATGVAGLLEVSAGGTASGTTVVESGSVIVSSGGTVSGTILDGTEGGYPGALLVVSAGGSTVGTVVSEGGEQVAGTASGTVVSGFLASQTVLSGGLAIGTVVSASAGGSPEQVVSSGGSARDTVLSGSVTEYIYGGGSATGLDLVAAGAFGSPAYLYLYGGSAGLTSGDTASGDVIDFAGGSATLGISGTTMPSATISGFDSGGPTAADTIDLQSVAFSSGAAAVLGSGNVLSVTEGGSTYTLTFDPTQSFAGEGFHLAADGGSGTAIVLGPPCYAAGTRIATPAGAVPVEALRVGDQVLAGSGGDWSARKVRWVGHVRIDLARHPRPDQAAPVRIRAGAFAPGVPQRDLLLSPDHAVFVDGVLIQAQALVNGATIVREHPPAIAYVHVELDSHALLLAEGLAAESYLDTGNRGLFAGESGRRDLHPDLSGAIAWDTRACAPLVLGGARVAAAHAALLARATALGHVLTADPAVQILADGDMLPLIAATPDRMQAEVPAGTRELHLLSRHFVPAWFAQDDRRRLGLAVRRLAIGGRRVPAASLGTGWHAGEKQWRWTDGAAVIHPPAAGRLTLLTAPTAARYWQDRPSEAAPSRPATDRKAAAQAKSASG